ncbi:MAG: VUT family protein, partial [Actinobacteria bacterium]|nr:VUT family protein [Actinomycetota bacterium]
MTTPTLTRPHFAATGSSLYPIIVAVFCSVLLISNIGATKLIEFGPLITDGGVFLFPLTYLLGDILSEVYGWKAARRAIILGFAMAILAAV